MRVDEGVGRRRHILIIIIMCDVFRGKQSSNKYIFGEVSFEADRPLQTILLCASANNTPHF